MSMRLSFVPLILGLALIIVSALGGCAAENERLIYSPVAPALMASPASPCANAWDATPEHPAHACSFAFADPLAPGKPACRIFYGVSGNHPDDIATETHNCAGVDLELARKEGRL